MHVHFDRAVSGPYASADAAGRPNINPKFKFSTFRVSLVGVCSLTNPSNGEANMDVWEKLSIFPPVEPAPDAATDSQEHSQRPVDAGLSPVTRQRVVLLPHTRIEPTDTRPSKRRRGGS